MVNTNSTETAAPAPPSIRLFGMEPIRATLEYVGMRRMPRHHLPRGDGHPIVVFPGLASDGRTMAVLREFLKELGYTVYDWGRGFNRGPKGDVATWLRELAEDIHQMVAAHKDEGVTLLGWSLGGIYAREVAKHLRTDLSANVRQVITIAAPFAGGPDQVRVGLLWRLVNGRPLPRDEKLQRQLSTAPAVPSTSIYSRTDGVVAWQACIQPGEDHQVEHVEVQASHCGMCWNPEVLHIIADRLQRRPMQALKRLCRKPKGDTQMNIAKKHLITAALLGGTLAAGTAALAQQQFVPALQRSGSVEYISGGIGIDESTAMKAISPSWPLTLEFAVNTQPRADYASNVAVTIRDARHAAVLQTTAQGPLLLVKLPPGQYSVDAEFAGRTITQNITVAQGKAAHQSFIWPAG
ncbi:alpha/beta fold hydrolase [Pelomonas sp. KK5]|uniref:alpha/beta fold hydrolase n=1 Tax=Pelomonas sp. KK5 TaxID=1855730 RepID=UPI00097C9EFB|nr:alpha/beta fold hydrolase [Pelomonas sp. KK5]